MCSGLLKLTKANVISARVTGISLHSSGEPGHGCGSGCTRVGGWWWQHGSAVAGGRPGPGEVFGGGLEGLSFSLWLIKWAAPT